MINDLSVRQRREESREGDNGLIKVEWIGESIVRVSLEDIFGVRGRLEEAIGVR